jgi:hypothetical protein
MMTRLLCAAAVLLLSGCPATKPSPAALSDATPSSPASVPVSPAAAPGPSEPAPAGAAEGSCGALIKKYLSERKKLNQCERDIDCAEHWPGLCPHGAFYAHRESDMSAVRAVSTQIHKTCVLPECEPPEQLGIAHCQNKVCVRGRSKPVETDLESCWDYEETYLEGKGRRSATTTKHQQGITPRMVLGVPGNGTVTLKVSWPASCAGCRLEVSEHNSGMAGLVKGTRTKVGGVETIVLPVTQGPYYLMGFSESGGERYWLEVELLDVANKPAGSTLHGVAWRRLCEG